MTAERWRVSLSGGQQPEWSQDGKELFFVALDGRLMAAPVSIGSAFSSGTPQPLFQTRVRLSVPVNQYAASADGQRFLVVMPTQTFDSEIFRVLLNWRSSR